ncbi:Hypothetical predicted protein [Mytilus galloprovincialis]|uniref:Uncharacterized protein n=1 Tax=Mytilus galloprovincialis TaxID=29158 RepID=A0A8B6DMC8_MYTGA|nr:Hypothetical predicted protein [Mytilus galloprovincialis]
MFFLKVTFEATYFKRIWPFCWYAFFLIGLLVLLTKSSTGRKHGMKYRNVHFSKKTSQITS